MSGSASSAPACRRFGAFLLSFDFSFLAYVIFETADLIVAATTDTSVIGFGVGDGVCARSGLFSFVVGLLTFIAAGSGLLMQTTCNGGGGIRGSTCGVTSTAAVRRSPETETGLWCCGDVEIVIEACAWVDE